MCLLPEDKNPLEEEEERRCQEEKMTKAKKIMGKMA